MARASQRSPLKMKWHLPSLDSDRNVRNRSSGSGLLHIRDQPGGPTSSNRKTMFRSGCHAAISATTSSKHVGSGVEGGRMFHRRAILLKKCEYCMALWQSR